MRPASRRYCGNLLSLVTLSAESRSRVYVTIERPSVCLSHRSTAATAAGRFAAERRASRRYRSTAAYTLCSRQRRSASNAGSVTSVTVRTDGGACTDLLLLQNGAYYYYYYYNDEGVPLPLQNDAYYYYYYYDEDIPLPKQKSRRQPLNPQAGRLLKRADRPHPFSDAHRRAGGDQQQKLARVRLSLLLISHLQRDQTIDTDT